MPIIIKTSTDGIDWDKVTYLLSYFGLSNLDASAHKKAFENSFAVAFAYDGKELIGVGRALSDGVCQAAIYNIALEEEYHSRQIGRTIVNSLLEQVKGCNVILYTHPKTVAMYEKFGFRRSKTGMVIFPEEKLGEMEGMGFLLPPGYRFGDNEYEREDT